MYKFNDFHGPQWHDMYRTMMLIAAACIFSVETPALVPAPDFKCIVSHGAAPEITRELTTEVKTETDATPAVKAEDEAEASKETSSAKAEETPVKVESRGMICDSQTASLDVEDTAESLISCKNFAKMLLTQPAFIPLLYLSLSCGI